MEDEKGLVEACQTSFEINKTWLVPAYLAFCQLGWHFPVESDKHSGGKHPFGMGPDIMREEAEKEALRVIKRRGGINDVNCNICWLSKIGTTIKESWRHNVHTAHWTIATRINSKEHVKNKWGRRRRVN